MRALSVGVLAILATAGAAHPRSLSDALGDLTTFSGQQLSSRDLRRVTELATGLERNAVRSADFPAAATNPGFTYSYDPELGAFERSTTSRGPVLVESHNTVGKGHFDVGLAYLYSDLDELDGEPLEEAFTSLGVLGTTSAFQIDIDQFDLSSQVLSTYATYGVTSDLDVNILVPVLLTEMRLRGTKRLGAGGRTFTERFDEDLSQIGVGDVLLRAKHRLPSALGVGFAGLLGLRLPTGDEDDFHGLGDFVVTPLLAIGRGVGAHDVHANLGVDVNADDLQRSRARYAAGVSVRALEPLTLLVDVIGSSSFVDDTFEVPGGTGSVDRSDIVDVAAGFKLALGDRVVVNAGALVPLTEDSLRAEVVPTAGVEVTF